MIKFKKSPLRYSTRTDISADLEYFMPSIGKYLKAESIRKLKVPKNTLRIIFKDKFTGWHGDGFARNVKTVRHTYNIITFKR